MESDWVMVESTNDEEELKECWRNLPFDVNFHEFRDEMYRLKRHHQRYRITKITLWCLNSIWTLSGYVGYMSSFADYKMLVLQLVLWITK